MKLMLRLLIVAMGVSLLAGGALAATYIEDNFDSDDEGWTSKGDPAGPAHGTLGTGDVDGDSEDELTINGDSSVTATDFIYSDSGDTILGGGQDLSNYNFGGTEGYQHAGGVTFDFWSNADKDDSEEDHWPSALELYFLSGSTYWRYTITVASLIDGWNPIYVSMYGVPGWVQTAGTASFEDALDSVDELGITLTYQNWDGQEYAIDNFRLHYPEPGTYAVLAFALMSLGVTFRGKIRSGIDALRRK